MFYTMKELASPTWFKSYSIYYCRFFSILYTVYRNDRKGYNIFLFYIAFVIELVYILLLKQEYWKSKKHRFPISSINDWLCFV